MITDLITPEYGSQRWHWPRYTDGCWGKPHVPKCPICKARFIGWLLKRTISRKLRR